MVHFNHDLTSRPSWLPPFPGPPRYAALHWWDNRARQLCNGASWCGGPACSSDDDAVPVVISVGSVAPSLLPLPGDSLTDAGAQWWSEASTMDSMETPQAAFTELTAVTS